MKQEKRSLDEMIEFNEIGTGIVVTAGPSDFSELQEDRYPCNEAMVSVGFLRFLHKEMIHKGIRKMIRNSDIRWKDELERTYSNPKIEFRKVIDLSQKGLQIEGKNPAIWIHLGHGGEEDSVPIISETEDGSGDFVTVNQIENHLAKGEGKIWQVLMPVCNGEAIAEALSASERVVNAWGSISSKPHTCWDEILNFLATKLGLVGGEA